MLDEQEKQKKTLLYLGIAVIIVTLLTIIGSFFTKSENNQGNKGNANTEFKEVQEEQINLFAGAYMNSNNSFYEQSLVKPEQLTDEQKRLISLLLIREFKTYQDSAMTDDGTGCQQLTLYIEEYEAILENYFGTGNVVSRTNANVNLKSVTNFEPAKMTYNTNDGTVTMTGDYMCYRNGGTTPLSQYVISSTDYQQEGNIVTATVKYYYRQRAGQTTNYINYQYRLYENRGGVLFSLTFDNNGKDYGSGISQEKEMISKYADQLAGLKFTFELRDDSYVQFKQVETVESEVK